jgi:hypothetical protein
LKAVNLKNSKGISVIFLVIAMLLMVTIGYVFSYLIPTKQKSVKPQIYSPQALFIAQSGAEFAIRYAAGEGWRGATDGTTFDLNRLDGITRTLGNGSFIINYNNAAGDILTSTGRITGSSETRIVRVSNFEPFLVLIFDPASTAPCWCRPITANSPRAQFYIKNLRSNNVRLSSFSATWTQTGTARNITRIDMNGTQKYTGTYGNGGAAQNLNRPVRSPTQTITPGQVIQIIVRWSGAMTTCTRIRFTFYTGTLGTENSFMFNLDSAGDGLPCCTIGCPNSC